MSDIDTDGIWIESTRAKLDAPAACLLRWGAVERYVPVDAVRQTAEDLMTCAAHADLIGELLTIGLDAYALTGLFRAILTKRQPQYFGSTETLFLLPAGSSKRKQGVVLLARRNLFHQGKSDTGVTPDEARTMARHWMEAAEASESDTLFNKVLHRAGWLSDDDLDAVFGLLYDIRGGKATLDET